MILFVCYGALCYQIAVDRHFMTKEACQAAASEIIAQLPKPTPEIKGPTPKIKGVVCILPKGLPS